MKRCPLHHLTYVPAKSEVVTANGKGDALEKKHYLTLTLRSLEIDFVTFHG